MPTDLFDAGSGKAYAAHGKGRVNRLENFRLRPTEDPQQSSLERQAAGQARESWLVTACKRAHQFALKVTGAGLGCLSQGSPAAPHYAAITTTNKQ